MTYLFIFDIFINVKATYKNSILNRKKIFQAYLTLLVEHKKVSVTEIVKLANINRGTFYLHFENVEEVGKALEADLAENFKVLESRFRMSEIDQSPEIIVEEFNKILLKDLDFYKLLANVATTYNLLNQIKISIFKLISNNFKIMRYVMNYERFKMVVQFIVGGILEVYLDWLKGNISCEIEEISRTICQIIKVGLKGYLSYAR